jgi:hypothetical protein
MGDFDTGSSFKLFVAASNFSTVTLSSALTVAFLQILGTVITMA